MANNKNNEVKKETDPNQIEIADVLVFKLSRVLGSRSEVLKTPLLEALFHYEWETMKEEKEVVMDFLNIYHAHPYADHEERKKHLELIKPNYQETEELEMKTDKDLLMRLKQQQDEGGITIW